MYRIMTPAFFDQVCRERGGLARVVNAGIPDKARETELQKDAIYRMLPPREWGTLSILDVCCGVGRLTGWLDKVGKGAAGVDWSEEMLKVALASCPGVRFAQADVGVPAGLPPVAPPKSRRQRFGMTFTWCAFIHIVEDERWFAAVENMKAWSRKWLLYCDKVNDNATVDYVHVRKPAEVEAAVTEGGGWRLASVDTFRGYPEDEFALMLFVRAA